MAPYKLIVPTKIETAISGYAGAVEKTYRGHLFRVEMWMHGTICKKDGEDVEWERLPVSVREVAHQGCSVLNRLQMALSAESAPHLS